jgi:hypothetical protein
MRKDFPDFLKAIFIFSAIMASLVLLVSYSFFPEKINLVTWLILSYFIIITSVFHLGLLKSSEGKPQAFIRYYMGATTIKLFIHVIVLLVYCLLNRHDAARFIITFLIFYMAYTAWEVAIASKRFRK